MLDGCNDPSGAQGGQDRDTGHRCRMTSFLKRIWRAMNGDLLGREEVVEKEHPGLGSIVYFGRKGEGGYWEAELEHPSLSKKFSVTLPGSQAGPEAAAVDFALSTVRDLDALFERCRASSTNIRSGRGRPGPRTGKPPSYWMAWA
jgi:hypothetical protein